MFMSQVTQRKRGGVVPIRNYEPVLLARASSRNGRRHFLVLPVLPQIRCSGFEQSCFKDLRHLLDAGRLLSGEIVLLVGIRFQVIEFEGDLWKIGFHEFEFPLPVD